MTKEIPVITNHNVDLLATNLINLGLQETNKKWTVFIDKVL